MSNELRGDAEQLSIPLDRSIPRGELVVRATRASGPGGQHVNKSSTRIELLWNVKTSAVLTPEEAERIVLKLGKRVDSDGWLRVVASESRSQLRNRRVAEERLVRLVRGALHVPVKRRATKPTLAARRERLRAKKIRGERKRARGRVEDE
jgi:ribosome-associated protein